MRRHKAPMTAENVKGIFRTPLILRLKKHQKSVSTTEKPATNSYRTSTLIIIVAGVIRRRFYMLSKDTNGFSSKPIGRKP